MAKINKKSKIDELNELIKEYFEYKKTETTQLSKVSSDEGFPKILSIHLKNGHFPSYIILVC